MSYAKKFHYLRFQIVEKGGAKSFISRWTENRVSKRISFSTFSKVHIN